MTSILIVDDEESLRITLSAVLEVEGFETTEASTAEEALSLLDHARPDLVLSDVRMPGVGGVGLAKALRERRPDLPVVLMTAFSEESTLKNALHAGVFTVLPKPFELDHIGDVLTRAMARPAVLLLDDAPEVLEAVSASLEQLGLRVETALDGESALARIEQTSVDVCLVDLAMPGVSGLDFTRRILSHEHSRRPHIIVFSGAENANALIQQAATQTGVFQCLRKPLCADTLVRVIAEARRAT